MKTICIKSGVPIWKTNYLLGFDLADEHPIFRAKTSLIFNKDMIHRFMQSEQELEKRLIFLAALNLTYHVDFNYPAAPSKHVMESCFQDAMFLAQWMRFADYKLAKIVTFPRYVINKDNADMKSIRAWLNSIDEIRQQVNRKELDRDKNAALLAREMEIKKELGEANFVGKAFTPKLAKWALDLCDVTVRHDEYFKWMKIMCLPLHEAWMVPLADYMELEALLQENLPFLEENPQAISVMFQMRSLIKECRKGFQDFDVFTDSNGHSSDFQIIDEDEEGNQTGKVVRINQQYDNVPTSEPVQSNYATKLQFLIAKAKWDLSQKGKQE